MEAPQKPDSPVADTHLTDEKAKTLAMKMKENFLKLQKRFGRTKRATSDKKEKNYDFGLLFISIGFCSGFGYFIFVPRFFPKWRKNKKKVPRKRYFSRPRLFSSTKNQANPNSAIKSKTKTEMANEAKSVDAKKASATSGGGRSISSSTKPVLTPSGLRYRGINY